MSAISTGELTRPDIARFADGQPAMLLWDLGDTDTPAEIIVGGSCATTPALAFMVRHGSGFIRVAMADDDADRLDLPSMFLPGTRNLDVRDTVAVDARDGVTTGISAADRAQTIRVLANRQSTPADLTRPGHIVPVRVRQRIARPSSLPSAALAIAGMAGLNPVVALCSLVSPSHPFRMASVTEGELFAEEQSLPRFFASHLAVNSMRC